MYRKLVLIIFILINLKSDNINNNLKDNYQIVANKLETNKDIIIASGDVIIFSKSYYMKAQKIIYNKPKETFELFGDVLIIKDDIIYTNSQYSFIDIKNDKSIQKSMFLLNKSSSLWMKSNKSTKNENIIQLENSILSSCNCEDPLWSIKFSNGNYNTKDNWIKTYNNRLLIKNKTILYLPYFAFPTNDTRSSGILIPRISYSSKYGLSIKQPFYIAPRDNYDIEIVPQIISKRGKGIYSYLRYIHSKNSHLYLSTGLFRENDKYILHNNLEDKNKYGYNLIYTNKNILSKDNKDGLYMNIKWLNDIEYINLENYNEKEYIQKIQSNIKYFYNDNSIYKGIYFNKYLDTHTRSSYNTIQKLPQLQFHKYNDSLFSDKLFYNFDLSYKKYYSKNLVNSNKIDIKIPFRFYNIFTHDYLKIDIKNFTQLTYLQYKNQNITINDGKFIENINSFNIHTDITKIYQNYKHILKLDFDFTLPKVLTQKGDLYNINNNNPNLNTFKLSNNKNKIDLHINQDIYKNESLTPLIKHQLKQSITIENYNTKFSNLENEIKINSLLANLSNRLIYSQTDKKIIENYSAIESKVKDYSLNIDYYESKNTPNSDKSDLKSLKIDTGINFYKDYKLSYIQEYNMKEDIISKEKISLNINDICWNFDISYGRELLPSDNIEDSNQYQRSIYFQLELKHLGGINFDKQN